MKEWSTKTATERAAAEPSLDYWSGDTSALEANIQQHWADISAAMEKLIIENGNDFKEDSSWQLHTNNSFPNYVQDFLGVVQRAKKSYYKSN